MARDYAKEYKNYHSRPEQIKKRSSRNKARRLAVKMGKAKKGDGKDIHHRDGNPLNNKNGNLQSMSKSKNRSFARTRTARKKRA
jgi:hypothetical protein|tara:strand:+ start:383 stop:634 length:252 start_codon:yes stop_codon:yes gene_type:complete